MAMRTVRSCPFWAGVFVTAAALVAGIPRAAEASCGPCGANYCFINGSCVGSGNSICLVPYNQRYGCYFTGGMCPTTVYEGTCGGTCPPC